MTKEERLKRIIARGEFSDHCHVICGNVGFDSEGNILVGENSDAVMRHLLESEWLKGNEVWTGEHHDIKLKPGKYQYVQQQVYDPLQKRIEAAKD